MGFVYEKCGNCRRRGAYFVAGRGIVRCKYCAAADDCRALHPSNLAAAAAGLSGRDGRVRAASRATERPAVAEVATRRDAEVRMEGSVVPMDLATITVLATRRAERGSTDEPGEPARVTSPPATDGPARAIVIDDDDMVSALVASTLERAGMTVAKAHSGEEGCAAVLAEPPDVAVLDLSMPGMDGLEVLVELRRRCDIGIVVVSGRANEGDRVVALELGADDYLAKPFAPAELMARVRSVLASRGQRRNAAPQPAGRSISPA